MAQYHNKALTGVSGDSSTIDFPGEPGAFMCLSDGKFHGATFQLQFTLDGTVWSDVPGAEMTIVDDDIGLFQLPPCRIRVNWSGGTTSTDVDVVVAPSWQGWFNDGANLPLTT